MEVLIHRPTLDVLPCRSSGLRSNTPSEQLCATYWNLASRGLGHRSHGFVDLDEATVAHLLVSLKDIAFSDADDHLGISSADLRNAFWCMQTTARMSTDQAWFVDRAMLAAVRSCARPVTELREDGTAEAFLRMLPTWEGSPEELIQVVEAMFPRQETSNNRPSSSSPARGTRPVRTGPIVGRGPRPRGRKRRAGRR